MHKIYFLKYEQYKIFLMDKEFCKNIKRPYYVIRKLKYKNKIINVAVPLRGNINSKFQKHRSEYIIVPPTKHTLYDKNNVAGWHITKIIPVKMEGVYREKPRYGTLIEAVKIASKNNKKDLIHKCVLMLKRFEKK